MVVVPVGYMAPSTSGIPSSFTHVANPSAMEELVVPKALSAKQIFVQFLT